MQSKLAVRSGAWYGEQLLQLELPINWEVNVLWPKTPPPLTEDQIAEALDTPVGQQPIRLLCKGKRRPLIIVDDLNRPTPPEGIINILLKHFQEAGIHSKNVTILMATGTHAKTPLGAMIKKVGIKAAQTCQLLVHDCFHNNILVGKSSFGTPIHVNPAILKSDFVIGIGGIYPNYTAGFGGGTKLALGVLGLQSTFDLHFRHKSAGWGSIGVDTSFREDLDEIARMIGLNTIISLQVDANREIIRLDSGDPLKYYDQARDFCRKTFAEKPYPDADVIISNAYPNDLSLTFARMKGFKPLDDCHQNASRVAIASCSEGIGLHNIFPFLNKPRFHEERYFLRLIKAHGVLGLSKRIWRNFAAKLSINSNSKAIQNTRHKHPILLYRPGKQTTKLPKKMPGILQSADWPSTLEIVKEQQDNLKQIKAIVYPCAFLQFISKN